MDKHQSLPFFSRQLIVLQDRILLNSDKDEYTLQIQYGSCKNNTKRINRIPKVKPETALSFKQIFAVYGIIQLEVNKYLIVITQASCIGEMMGNKIFKVDKLQMICLCQNEDQTDRIYVDGLYWQLDNKTLYFSQGHDFAITNQIYGGNETQKKICRSKYMFNQALMLDFFQAEEATQWVTSFISGFVSIKLVNLNKQCQLKICLITRRNKLRQGVRYLTRGIDEQGNTANTCLTQTILQFYSASKQCYQYFSYEQLRGSIPLIWSQNVKMIVTAKCEIKQDDDKNIKLMRKNYDEISKQYQKCLLINLIDQQGFQNRLGVLFEKIHKKVNKEEFKFIWFDFHKQCRKGLQNLAKIINLPEIQQFGYDRFQNVGNNIRRKQNQTQNGIIRTNCIDCLDRTNIVQTAFARRIVLFWLIKLNIVKNLSKSQVVTQLPGQMQKIFKNQWIENGDIISKLYTGTDAIKKVPTLIGKLQDVKTWGVRTINNNFYDSIRQYFIELSLGQINPYCNQDKKIKYSAFQIMTSLASQSASGLITSLPYSGKYTTSSKFKNQFSEQQRYQKYLSILNHYEQIVPIIAQKHVLSKLPEINPCILGEANTQFYQFCSNIRSKILKPNGKDKESQSLFFFVGRIIPAPGIKLSQLYQKFKDEDGFLYITYQEQQAY